MNDWSNQTIDIYFNGDVPKLTGKCMAIHPTGVVVETEDDGTAIAYKIAQIFVPFSSIRHVHRLVERSNEEQEAKKHELNERFRRQMMESHAAPNAKVIDTLKEELD